MPISLDYLDQLGLTNPLTDQAGTPQGNQDILADALRGVLEQNQIALEQQRNQYDLLQEYISLGGSSFTDQAVPVESGAFQIRGNPYATPAATTPDRGLRGYDPLDSALLELADINKQQLQLKTQMESPVSTLPGARRREVQKQQQAMLNLQKAEIDANVKLRQAQREIEEGRRGGDKGLDPNSPFAKASAELAQVSIADIATGKYKVPDHIQKQVADAMKLSTDARNYLYTLSEDDPQTAQAETERLFEVGLNARGVVYGEKEFADMKQLKAQVHEIAGIAASSNNPREDLRATGNPIAAEIARSFTEEQWKTIVPVIKPSSIPERQQLFRTVYSQFMQKAVGAHQAMYLMDVREDPASSSIFMLDPEDSRSVDAARVTVRMKELGVSNYASGIQRMTQAIKDLAGGRYDGELGEKMLTAALNRYNRKYGQFGALIDRQAVGIEYNKFASQGIIDSLKLALGMGGDDQLAGERSLSDAMTRRGPRVVESPGIPQQIQQVLAQPTGLPLPEDEQAAALQPRRPPTLQTQPLLTFRRRGEDNT